MSQPGALFDNDAGDESPTTPAFNGQAPATRQEAAACARSSKGDGQAVQQAGLSARRLAGLCGLL